jgi:uncharacterized protein YuzE
VGDSVGVEIVEDVDDFCDVEDLGVLGEFVEVELDEAGEVAA